MTSAVTASFFLLIIASLLIMLVSLSGVVFIWSYLKNLFEGNLHYLISFATGVFLVVSIHLFWESFLVSPTGIVAIASVLFGFLIVHSIHVIFPESHHHHEHRCEYCGRKHNKKYAYKILISDAIHNIGDGILLAPAFIANTWLGVTTTIGIIIHEAVQEISEFFILRESGYTTPQALLRNVIVSSTILIGAISGFFIASVESFMGILLGVASGGFIHVVFLDMIPRSLSHTTGEKRYFKFISASMAGALLILALTLFTAHNHTPTNPDTTNHKHNHDHI